MQLSDVRPLVLLAGVGGQGAAGNVAYNAIRLFYKVIEGLDAELKRLDWRGIVLGQHLVECGRDVHCVEEQATWGYGMTLIPAGMPRPPTAGQPMTQHCT